MIRKNVKTAANLRSTTQSRSFIDFPFLLSLASGLLLFAAFPPIGLEWLAWIAPVPWLLLVEGATPAPRRFYVKVWAGASIHWLIMLQGVRLAHPANYLGWVALSLYIAAYVPAFVAISRYAFHVTKIPLTLATATVWTGLEMVRGYMLTGFSMALLGHTQTEHIWLIQIADLTGAYGVSFLVMLIAGAIVSAWRAKEFRRRWVPAALAAGCLLLTCGYGSWRCGSTPDPSTPPLRVALLQGTRDKVFEFNPEFERKSFEQYRGLMKRARDTYQDLDLIVWPEGSFTELVPEYLVEGEVDPPPEAKLSAAEFKTRLELGRRAFADKTHSMAAEANLLLQGSSIRQGKAHLFVGVTTVEFVGNRTQQRNTALWIDPAGDIQGRYYKMHPVMFGEYIPFGRWWPWLYKLTPMPQGLTPGESPSSFDVAGYRLSPSVCFESTVPQVMRGHVRQLAANGTPPDILVNVSDDGWFWGASILDLQLACGVFRAVELRRPFLVAANTGITAAIASDGGILEQLPRRREGIVHAEIRRDGRTSVYERYGDVFAFLCLALTAWWSLKPRLLNRTSRLQETA